MLKSADIVKSLLGDGNAIGDFIKGKKISDISEIFSLSKISEADMNKALIRAGMVDKIDDITDAMSSFSASQKGVNGLTTAFKNLGSAIMGVLKSPITWTFVALGTAIFAAHKYLNRFNDALEKSGESLSTYQDSKGDLENLKSEAENVRSSLEELGGKYNIEFSGTETVEDMIGKIESVDTITLTDQNDLETLKQQNAELERQIQLQEKVVEKDKKEAQKDANKVLNMQTTTDLTQQDLTGQTWVNGVAVGSAYEQTDIRTATKNEIAYLEQLYADKIQLNEEYQNTVSETEKELIQGRIQNTENEIEKYTDEITKNIESLESVKEAFNDGTVEGQAIYDDINAIIDSFNNADLSPLERDLKKLDSVFNTKAGKVIKKSLMDASDSTLDLAEAMGSLGLSMKDLGVDSIETLQRYLQEAKGSVDELKDSMHELTVADVEKAFESPNQGANWDTMATRFKETKELYKNGLIGTDDFQTFTQWLLPRDIKIPETFGDQEFKKYWEDKSQKASRWFNAENPVKGMWDFLGDLKTGAPELFDTFDKGQGLVKFTEQFNNSAQAAAKLGYNVDVIDTMLHKLEEYGFNFGEEFMFSGEAANEFNNALSGMKSIYDSMADGKLRDALGEDILNWEEQYATLDGDLSKLTNEHVIDIKFNYDMALLDQQISEFDDKWLNGNKTSEVGAARIASRNQKLSELEKYNEYDVGNDVGYAGSYNNISSLQGNFAFAETSDDIAAIQEQIIAVQDMQLSFQETLASGKVIDWEHFLQTDEAKNQMKSLVENGTLTVEELAEAFDISAAELEMTLKATDDVTPVIDNINKQKLFDKYVSLYGEDEATGIINLWNILEADQKFTQLSAEDQASVVIEYWDSLEPEQKTGIITSQITAEDGASGIIANVDSLMAALDASEPTADLKANDYVTPAVATAKYALDSLNGKIAHTYLYTHKETIEGSNASGTVHAKGTAFAQGTAHINGNIPNDALVNPKYRTSKSEDALIGELGPELEVDPDTGTFEIIGANGAEFRHIPSGRIIFNHQQTKELLSKGYTLSRGKAKVTGTAFSNGGFLPTASNGYNYTGTNSGKYTDNGSSKGNSGNDAAEETFEEIKDWVEVYLQRQERLTQRTVDAIEDAVGLADKQAATNAAIAQTQAEIAANQKGAAEYAAKANSVDLSSTYKQQVIDGTLDIETITDENLKEKIDEFTEWHEKMLDCEDTIEDLKDDLRDLRLQKFENITEEFENQIGLIEHEQNLLEGSIDLLEERGLLASEGLYKNLISAEEEKLAKLEAELTSLNEEMANAKYPVGSPDWYEAQAMINETKEAILESKQAMVEFDNAIRELEWEKFDLLIERFARVKEDSDFWKDLMSHENMFDSETGQITAEGQATLGLYAQDYNTQMVAADEYFAEMKRLEAIKNSDPEEYYDLDLDERYEEMKSGWQDSVSGAFDSLDEAIDVIQEGFDSFLDAMDKVIDARKEALKEEKELYDYQKEIAEHTKEIGNLEKQLAAYQGNDSEEARATIQRLQNQLTEAKDALEETEYDKYISDQEQMLDTLRDETEEWMNQRMDDRDWLLQQIIDYTNSNGSTINDTLNGLAKEVGGELSTEMAGIWGNEGSYTGIVTKYGDDFGTASTTTNATLDKIKEYIRQMGDFAEEEGEKIANEANTPVEMPETPKVEAPAPTPPQPPSNPSGGDGVPRVGDKVTFASGRYYHSSDGINPSGKNNLGGQVYITSYNSAPWATKPYHISTGSSLGNGDLGWVSLDQLQGYATGGLVRRTGVAMLHGTEQDPELVLNAQQTKSFMKMANFLSNQKLMDSLSSAMSSGDLLEYMHLKHGVPVNSSMGSQNIVVNIGDIQVHGVNDAQALAHEIKAVILNNKAVQGVIQESTLGVMTNKNSLGKYRL